MSVRVQQQDWVRAALQPRRNGGGVQRDTRVRLGSLVVVNERLGVDTSGA